MNQYNTGFKVATLNLFNYIAPPNAFYDIDNIYTQRQWQQKEKWIHQQLRDLVPDIVGFQEVFSPSELEAITKVHGLEHFVTVSSPGVGGQHVYDKPVVALASRFPIVSADAVTVSDPVIKKLKLQGDFNFSRPPIRAVVKIDDFTSILVYVLHLKSKRSQLESQKLVNENENVMIADSLLAEIQGSWMSTVQRGTEAMLVYHDIIEQMLVCERPVIVMGDLNDTIDSSALQPLIGSHKLDRLDGKMINNLPITHQRIMDRFILHDAFDLQDKVKSDERKSTHYFMNQGSVLDYILLSKDFKSEYDQSLASVERYCVNDKHLINPHHVHDAGCSDHAPVMVEIEIRI